MRLGALVGVLSTLAMGGCVAVGLALKPVTDPLDAALLAMEPDHPPQAASLKNEPLDRIVDGAVDFDIWSQFELARRYELGLGTERDLTCAYYWYDQASWTHYAAANSAGFPEQRRGHPSAKKGKERLAKLPEVERSLSVMKLGRRNNAVGRPTTKLPACAGMDA